MHKEGLFCRRPCSVNKYFNPQSQCFWNEHLWHTEMFWSLWTDVKETISHFYLSSVFQTNEFYGVRCWTPFPKMALLVFISCSQCVPFKITDSQQHLAFNFLQICGFPDLAGYGNSENVTYVIHLVILFTAKNATVSKA